jgi:hypothetical protein
MACQRFAAAIGGHALGAPLAAEAAAHVTACAACQSALDAERRLLATIDEAIADVGSTAPSPHFVSRLRAHVAVAPPRWGRRHWLMPALAAAVTLLSVALIVPRSAPDRSDRREAASTRSIEVPPAGSRISAIEHAKSTVTVATVVPLRRARARTTAAGQPAAAPEVLVPEHERAAVGRLFASLRTGRPEVVSMLMRLRGGDPVTDAQTLTIQPLRIDPIVVSELPGAAAIPDK